MGFWISTVDPVVNEQLSMTVSPMLYDVLEPPGDTLAPSTKTSSVPSLDVSEPVMTLMQKSRKYRRGSLIQQSPAVADHDPADRSAFSDHDPAFTVRAQVMSLLRNMHFPI